MLAYPELIDLIVEFLNLSVLVHERLYCHAPSSSTDDQGEIDLRLILRLQLRFVRSNERANVGRHVQQPQPLFLV